MNEDLSAWALAARMGWTVVITIVASLLLGIWVDSLLHTSPFGTLFFVFLGSVVAIIGIYRQAVAALEAAARRRQHKDQGREPPRQEPPEKPSDADDE